MDNVIRLSKFVKNLGIVTTVLFLIIVLVTFVTGNMGVAICFMPFVFLGIALILAYKKQIIVVNEDEIVFSYLVKKTQHIKYNDIRCILMIPLNGRTDVILIDKMYNRLVTLEQVYVNYDILYDTLIKHEIDLVALDILVVIIGVLLGGKFGICTIITVIISGPIIQFVNAKAKRILKI